MIAREMMAGTRPVPLGHDGSDASRCLTGMLVATALSLAVAVSVVLTAPVAAQDAGHGSDAVGRPICFLLDRSGSMREHGRMKDTRESAKLGAVILSGPLQVVAFSDVAEPSPVFDLDTQRIEAMEWLGRLTPGGGTHFGNALQAVSSDAVGALMLSDGIPSDPPDAILRLLRERLNCPLHTIAVETHPEAEQLLAQMAAVTGGGFYKVQGGAEVAEAFLRILGTIRQFHRLEVSSDAGPLTLTAQGELLVLGDGVEPRLAVNHPIERHQILLQSGPIHTARVVLPQPQKLTVSAVAVPAAQPGRLTVLRFDLPSAVTTFRRLGTQGGQTTVQAETRFLDPGGRTVDPRGTTRLSASYELQDQAGKIHHVEGRASATRPVLDATFAVPSGPDARTVIRSRTVDRSAGVPFSSLETHVVQGAKLPGKSPVDPPEPNALGLGGEALQLLIVAHRRSGRTVLFDSEQAGEARALTGDRLSLELVRGTMDPRVLVSLGTKPGSGLVFGFQAG